VLIGAACDQLGPGVGLWLVLLAGTAGNALTAVAYGTQHNSVGASTAMFGAIGILAATRITDGTQPRASGG
jgi:rhomboid protease GluP